ncbi:MAG TPA: acyltransferase family protein, partial [Novosphingobium sp.]
MLFAVLGQALARSRAEQGLGAFVLNRLVRDWVPLACVVLAMAAVVGPLVTDHSPRTYFADRALWSFLGNLIGVPQFALPGVFEFNNESRTTLGLLWSVPAYMVLVAAVAAAGRREGWRRAILPAVALLAIGAAVLLVNLGIRPLPDSGFSRAEAIGIPLTAVLAGLLGAAWTPFHLARPRRRLLLLALIVLFAAAGYMGERDWVGSVLAAIGLALGGNAVLLTRGTRRRDWDQRIRPWMPVVYCAWLVSFPVQQLVVIDGPPAFGAWRNLVLSVPIALAVGVVLWRLLVIVLVRAGA